jgi:hypothetical protein
VAKEFVKLPIVNFMIICAAVLEWLYVVKRTDSDFGTGTIEDLEMCRSLL